MRLVEKVHLALAETLRTGDVAVDATVGNGHDLLFLCRLVGTTGKVHGFDLQEEALTSSRRRLQEAGVLDRCLLYHEGHEGMSDVLPQEIRRRTQAITFNLGFLPGSDKSVVTRPSTTIAGLEASTEWLAPNGLLAVTTYRGHPGGSEEARAVEDHCSNLSSEKYAISTETTGGDMSSPLAFLVRKKS